MVYPGMPGGVQQWYIPGYGGGRLPWVVYPSLHTLGVPLVAIPPSGIYTTYTPWVYLPTRWYHSDYTAGHQCGLTVPWAQGLGCNV